MILLENHHPSETYGVKAHLWEASLGWKDVKQKSVRHHYLRPGKRRLFPITREEWQQYNLIVEWYRVEQVGSHLPSLSSTEEANWIPTWEFLDREPTCRFQVRCRGDISAGSSHAHEDATTIDAMDVDTEDFM
jgi:hypothetical protein